MNLNVSRTFAVDLAERAGWTFAQAFIGAAVLVILGANTQNVVHLDFWQQVGAAGVGGGAGAVASLVKGVVAGVLTGTPSTSKTVAAATASTPAPEPKHAAPVSQPIVPPVSEPAPADGLLLPPLPASVLGDVASHPDPAAVEPAPEPTA